MAATIAGFDELNRKLMALGDATQIKRVARNGIRAGLRVLAKSIKAKIPGKYKDERKAIGTSFKRTRFGENAGQLAAKVGAAVGKKQSREQLSTGKQSDRSGARGRRRGVGIDERNIHWAILGTTKRQTGARSYRVKGGGRRTRPTGNVRRNTGTMPAILKGVVQAGVSAGQADAAEKLKQNIAAGIARVAKG